MSDEELSPEEAAKIVAMTVPRPKPEELPKELSKKPSLTRDQELALDLGVDTPEDATAAINEATNVLEQVTELRAIVFKYALAGLKINDFHDLTEFFYREAGAAVRDIAKLRVQNKKAVEFSVELVKAAARQQEADARAAEEDPEFAAELIDDNDVDGDRYWDVDDWEYEEPDDE